MDARTPAPISPAARAAADRRRISGELRRAARAGMLQLHFQPRVGLASGQVLGAEALLRWPHPSRGMILPGQFIPVAEASDLIVEIGGWVMREAALEAARWPDPRTTVAVNVSPRQLRDGALLGQIAESLEVSGLPPERLEIELTESVLMDSDPDVLLCLAAIRDLGVGVALDDFGTGWASLAMLKRLPLTTIKLDRTFLAEVPGQAEDAAIARAVGAIGRALHLAVVAEGIETEEQRCFVLGIGCEEAQGYLFGRPAPAEALRARLAAPALTESLAGALRGTAPDGAPGRDGQGDAHRRQCAAGSPAGGRGRSPSGVPA